VSELMVIDTACPTIFRRAVWYLVVLDILSYPDRVNIGFAARDA
jgi:hypothetical protein